MTADAVADLKQHVTATISHHIQLLREDLHRELHDELRQEWRADLAELRDDLRRQWRTELHDEVQGLHKKIDDLSASVADTLQALNEDNDKRWYDHERRIVRLEEKTA